MKRKSKIIGYGYRGQYKYTLYKKGNKTYWRKNCKK